MTDALNVWDYERLAEAKLEPGAHGYYAGGADDEVTLRDNVAAYRRLNLRPRLLVDVEPCTGDNRARPGDRAAGARRAGRLPAGSAPGRRGRDGACGARGGHDHVPVDARDVDAAEVAEVGGQRWFQLYVFRDEGVTAS